MIKAIILALMLPACTHAFKSTKKSKNKSNMMLCRAMCGKRVKSFTPITGECECYFPAIQKPATEPK